MCDQRNNGRIHQRHRHAIRATKKQKQIMSYYSSHYAKRTRSPARSSKRKQLTKIDDNYIQRYEKDITPTNKLWKISKEYTVQYAINTNNSHLLNFLLRNLKIGYSDRNKIRYPHTILTDAINRGSIECIKTILDNIYARKIYSTMIDHVCSNGRTALWYACKNGNLDLVQELIQRGQANINKCGILIAAAQNGHENIVHYLLRKGSDPNRYIKNYNERALHAASRRNHLNIVKLLLKYGANPTIFDYKKRTPLDYAIHKRHNDIAKILIDHQSGYFPINGAGFTPFMLATHCNNKYIVDIFVSLLSHQQVLDEMTLLACKYIIDGSKNKRDLAYSYFEKALSTGKTLCTSEPCEAYEFFKECQTLDELFFIRDNDNTMRNYALIVNERILLKNNYIDAIILLITKQSNLYKRNESYHRCLQLELHAYRLIIQAKHKRFNNSKLHEGKLSLLVKILFKLLQKEKYLPFESIAFIWTSILNRNDNKLSNLIFKLLFIITYLIEIEKINGKEQHILMNLIRRTMRENITMKNKYFLFSFCVDQISRGLIGYAFANISISALSMIRLLIQYGANVDEVNSITKATPLHLIARCHDMDHARPLIRIILDANAHTDFCDILGQQPEDLTTNLEMKEFIHINEKLSLKCLCAHLIHLKKVNYHNCLSSNLINFVQMHNKNEINFNDQSIRLNMMNYSSIQYNTLPRYRSILDNS